MSKYFNISHGDVQKLCSATGGQSIRFFVQNNNEKNVPNYGISEIVCFVVEKQTVIPTHNINILSPNTPKQGIKTFENSEKLRKKIITPSVNGTPAKEKTVMLHAFANDLASGTNFVTKVPQLPERVKEPTASIQSHDNHQASTYQMETNQVPVMKNEVKMEKLSKRKLTEEVSNNSIDGTKKLRKENEDKQEKKDFNAANLEIIKVTKVPKSTCSNYLYQKEVIDCPETTFVRNQISKKVGTMLLHFLHGGRKFINFTVDKNMTVEDVILKAEARGVSIGSEYIVYLVKDPFLKIDYVVEEQ